jgi:hypothetical protein
MKLNFWQWIGVVLILGVVVWIIYDRTKGTDAGTSQPSTKPAGQY